MDKPDQPDPSKIVHHLLKNDPFSQWMGIEIVDVKEGFCKVSCSVRNEMLNGFNVTHGGILFSLADTALAFSAATYGRVALALDNSISFTKTSSVGNQLIATSKCINLTHKTGVFECRITNSSDKLLAIMIATVYRTSEDINL
ncbi:MAG: hotdog fold thioesterase [Balneolaceae bacterium]